MAPSRRSKREKKGSNFYRRSQYELQGSNSIRRSQRLSIGRNFIKYHASNSLVEAENTIFSEWMKFWNEKDLIEPDLTVCVEDGIYPLHSSIMMFWSEYFQENLKEHKPYMFELRDMKRICFDAVLKFIYHGDFILDEENLENIIMIANILKIDSILMICADYIILNLRRNSRIVDLVELLCLSSNQYSLKIIIPKLFKRWDKFISEEVLKRISLKVMKLMITCSNKIPRLDEKKLAEICCTWISADIEHRFYHITELLECMTGKMNVMWDFNHRHYVPKNFADVKNVFHGLLHRCIDGNKIDFFNHFGLVIRKEDDQIANRMIGNDNLVPSYSKTEVSSKQQMSRFYFKQWRDKLNALRQIDSLSDIVVEVDSGQVFNLHYGVLCVSSKFFRDLTADSRSHVRLNLTSEEFVSVLNFMYGEVLNITSDNILNIVRANRLLNISPCQELILKYLKENIASLNVLTLFECSFSEDNDDVSNYLKKRVLENFANFKKHSISSLRLDCFKWLMTSSSKKLNNLSIDERQDLCCDWVARDIRKRYLSGPELFKAVGCLDKSNENSVSEGLNFNIKLRKKILPNYTQPITKSSDKPAYGKDFVISIPRIDLNTFEYTEERDIRKNSLDRRSFYIRIARLDNIEAC